MYVSGALVGGLRALSHLAHGYCPTGGGEVVSVVDTDTGGLCSMITGAIDSVVVKVEDSLGGSDNTTSGILGHSVIGHEWISDITPLFFSSTTKDTVSSIYDSSTDISGTPVSANGRIIHSFTDLLLYTVDIDLVNDTVPATTTDLIVAPKYDLILWEDAPMCTVSERWFITRDIIALPVYEIAVWPWVLPNSASVWKGPHLGSWTTWLDPAPLLAEKASGPWAKNMADQLSAVTRCLRQRSNSAIGTWSISRALTLVFGLGLYLLVVGVMLWSTLATSWYNTGLGNGVSLAALEVAQFGLNYFSPVYPSIHLEHCASVESLSIVEDYCDPWEGILELYFDLPEEAHIPDVEEDLFDFSDEELEHQILELTRKGEVHNVNIDTLECGIADFNTRLAAADHVLDAILAKLDEPLWENIGDGAEEDVET
ncbi:hypothetical protein C8Q72DRAFT_40852 [Fomitopsis betulina]|nr:hypothetical protein C8Q72DRAFT_40852 [Fomitopsis betulina]